MIIVSVDPGRTASWARYDTERPFGIEVGVMELVGSGRLLRPSPAHIREVIAPADVVLVEEVGARPEQGASSMFTFGMCVGTVLGAAGDKPLVLVTPQEWKSASRLGGLKDDAAKKAARAYATELFPGVRKPLSVAKNHGMAEAALMARWFFLKGPGKDVKFANDDAIRRKAETFPALAA